MATTEHTINDALAEELKETRYSWRSSEVVSSENSGMLKDSNERPDILILEENVSPVAIETEVLPAATVEQDAIARLGKQVKSDGRSILSAVAVRLPERVRTKSGKQLRGELRATNDLEFAMFTGSGAPTAERWPKRGWLKGGVADLSTLTQSATIPPDVILAAAEHLVDGVSEAAALLGTLAQKHPGSISKICQEMKQEDDEQTRRMATTILANAMVFQESLAGGPGDLRDVKSLDELRGGKGTLTKSAILAEWRKILKVNYWPIFDIARRILEDIPSVDSKYLIDKLAVTTDRLVANRLMRSHDLTGAVFQKLIADRKFLAAFYTTPASASLLAGLAIGRNRLIPDEQWGDRKRLSELRIADFACGTGTLLSTVYQHIGQLHELAGGNSESLHPQMMATGMVGCDVLPAAAHLTASMLAGAHPTVKYTQSSIMTVAYGRQPDGTIALGSLDLLEDQRKMDILTTSARAFEGMGESERETWTSLPHRSFDLVIMNPPFTRATGHEGKKVGVPNPMFAAFSSSKEEQRLMSKATQTLTKGTAAHGNAGEASIFLVLGDRKLKTGGVLALVMPLSLISGEAWENARSLLMRGYKDLVVASIAGTEDHELSFSADTGMGECLIVGTKSKEGSSRATFVVLRNRPTSPLIGSRMATEINRARGIKIRRLEDGPVGGTEIMIGDDPAGELIDAPLPTAGGWNLSRITDLSLAQTAYQLASEHLIWLPSMTRKLAIRIPMTTVGKIGVIGPYHADINGSTSDGGIRGPFDVVELKGGSIPTYPVLWAHDAKRETTFVFEADSEGVQKNGKTKSEKLTIEEKVESIARTASHCHFNRDFRFNSQPTSMQFTRRRTIGGHAWTSITLPNPDLEKALVAWSNTTLGMLMYWWHSSKQQSGRGRIGKSALEDLPVLDVTTLTPAQLSRASGVFETFSTVEFRPLNEAAIDPARQALDEAFASRVLGLDLGNLQVRGALDLLRRKLSVEPSVRGSKKPVA